MSFTAATPAAQRLTPSEVLRLYYHLPGAGDARLLAFANALADHYLGAPAKRARVPLAELPLPTVAYGSLRRAGYEFLDEVARLSVRDLLLIRNIGPGSANKIREVVQQFYS